jgi:O-methyltransferase
VSNIVNDKVENYIRETLKPSQGLLRDLELYAEENSVPIIHKEVADLLRVILKLKRPKKILELGCAIGYSSLFFADVLDGDVEIVTTERNPIMLDRAQDNIKKAGMEDRIKILVGDAEETLKDLEGTFDMIFIDAAKGHYKMFFDMLIGKLNHGGIVISDNILYKGMIASDDYVVRRKKTIVKRMRTFLDYICDLEGISTSLIPIGDGLAISYKD